MSPLYLAGACLFFVLGTTLSLGLLGAPVVAVAIGLLLASVPLTIGRQRVQSARSELRDAWPDVLAYTRTSISAGATLEDAFLTALERTDSTDPEMAEAIRREVGFGGGFRSGLEQIRVAHQDPTTDRVVITLASASGAGGTRVGDVVGVLATSVGDEIRLRKAHDASLTEQRWTVNVALVAPWVLLALSIATNPQAKEAFDTAQGAVVVGIGFAATVSGWLLARRTARLSEPPRVFR
jgi:tight adherence protein B